MDPTGPGGPGGGMAGSGADSGNAPGNVDGGSGIGLDHSQQRGFRGQARGRGKNRGNPHGGGWGGPNTVDPGLAAAMEDAYAQLQDAFGHNMPSVGYGRGFSRGSKGMPQHQRDSGWRAGQTLTDKYGNPTTLDNLSFARDDLLEDENYDVWAQANPDKARSMPGMLGGFLNSMGLHDLSGAMTPQENAFADSRWGGSISDGPQQGMPRHGGIHTAAMRMAQDAMRQQQHERALATEGGDNYDGRFERRNPRAYGDWEGGEAN